jgi:hypothetical protein
VNNRVFSEEVRAAKDWITASGIQNAEGQEKGGFNSWFDLDSGKYSYVYSEITGYGITALMFLKELFEGDFVKRAEWAADWLMTRAAHPSGGVRTRYYLTEMKDSENYSFESDNFFAFDCGMVLYGLVNLYKVNKDEKVLKFAVRLADLMIGDMRKPDGMFYAVYNPGTGKKEDTDWKWSSQSGSYHAKLAMGFIDLFEVTGKKLYKDVVTPLCERSLLLQEESGRFVTSRRDNSTHLHPNAYSAEGLLYAGLFLGREDFIVSASKAVKWALDNRMADGGVPKFFDGAVFSRYCRTDILSQVLRLGSFMVELGALDKGYRPALTKLRSRLEGFQIKDEAAQNGGFYYGYTLEGKEPRHVNSWCGMFALQGLYASENGAAGKKGLDKLRCFI